MRLVVLKLGGSLLLRPDLPSRLRQVLSELTETRTLIVVGGGTAADVVRDWSCVHHLPEETAHWLAVTSLSLTRALILRLMPGMREVSSLDAAQRSWRDSNEPLLLDIDAFLRGIEPTDTSPLPHTWDVTTDSIAAWTALRWSADELLLLKSADLNPAFTVHAACRAGLVDNHFPSVGVRVPKISWCNLAGDSLTKTVWIEDGRLVRVLEERASELGELTRQPDWRQDS